MKIILKDDTEFDGVNSVELFVYNFDPVSLSYNRLAYLNIDAGIQPLETQQRIIESFTPENLADCVLVGDVRYIFSFTELIAVEIFKSAQTEKLDCRVTLRY